MSRADDVCREAEKEKYLDAIVPDAPEWQKKIMRKLMRDTSMRQTGRTTRMLIAAHDAKVLGAQVLIIAPNSSVMEQLIRTARALGIMGGGVQPRPLMKFDFTSTHHVVQGKLRGYRGEIFEDHTVMEFSPPKAYLQEIDMWYASQVPKPEPVPSATVSPRWKFVPF
jgi:hypothetical protein